MKINSPWKHGSMHNQVHDISSHNALEHHKECSFSFQGTFLQYYINGISDGRSISLNTWYHVVLTYDGSTATLYTNGQIRTKACFPPTWPSEGMYLGDRSAGGRQFLGIIDEVQVF